MWRGHRPERLGVGPRTVTVEWSVDGNSWSAPINATPSNPVADPKSDSKRLKYKANLSSVKAQYLRLVIYHPARLPDWHDYKGEPAWLMIDEVEVR